MTGESFLDNKKNDSDVLKKNTNTPQFARLERKDETRAEEAKVQEAKKPKILLKKLSILLKKQRSYY